MKKLLLSASAFIFALSVSAQALVGVQSISSATDPVAMRVNVTKQSLENVKDFSSVIASTAKVKAAQSAKAQSIYTDIISDNDNGKIHSDYLDNFEQISKEIDGVTYNVLVTLGALSVPGEKAQVYGVYDEDNKTLTIPAQKCYEHSKFGRFDYVGLKKAEGDNLKILDNVTYELQDDGTWSCQADGWCMLMVDEKAGDYKNSPWILGLETALYPVNAVVTGSKTGKEGWERFDSKAYVDDQTSVINVYNFEGALVNIDVQSDGKTVSMATGQHISQLPQKAIDDGFGEYMNIAGVKKTGEDGIAVDETVTSIPGTMDMTSINFPEYFVIVSKIKDESGWLRAWYHEYTITRTTGAFAAGIKGVSENVAKANDNRLYNLSGQQVDKDYKGIVVKNGKKYLNK